MALCSICLRTNLYLNTVDSALISFYDNLLDHEIFLNLKACGICLELLKKCYNFKELCQKSNKQLQNWRKKKKPEILIESLHSLVRPYYDKVLNTNDEIKNKTKSENINIIETNNDNSIPNNDDKTEMKDNGIEIKDNVIEIDDSEIETEMEDNGIEIKDNSIEINENEVKIKDNGNENKENKNDENEVKFEGILRNNEDLFQSNDIFMETIEIVSPLKNKQDLYLNDNEQNRIGDNNDGEDNAFGDDTKIDDEDSDGTDDNSREVVKKRNVVQKRLTKKQKRELKKELKKIKIKKIYMRKQLYENYESIFDIKYFKTKEDAKADLMERPNSDYYKNAPYKCTVCYSVYKIQKMLDYHMKWHDVSAGDLVCDICEMRFKKRRTLQHHYHGAHYARYSCKKCSLVTHHTSAMKGHYRLHQGQLYKCKHCDKTFRNNQVYMTHLRNYHPSVFHKSDNVCTLCGRTFVSRIGLLNHKGRVHQMIEDVKTETSVKCDECNLTFANKEAYTVHVNDSPCHKDIAETMIACATCGMRFNDDFFLAEHRRQEHPSAEQLNPQRRKRDITKGKGPRTCKLCGETVQNKYYLSKHRKTVHPSSVRKVYNPNEPKKLKSSNNDEENSKPQRYLCDQCGKEFRLRCLLKDHMLVHTGERPYACGECGRAFPTRHKLALHSEWHRPPTRECKVCHKKFVSASNLFNHSKIHTGELRYKCSICGKGFIHHTSRREHELGVHQNIRRVRKPKQT